MATGVIRNAFLSVVTPAPPPKLLLLFYSHERNSAERPLLRYIRAGASTNRRTCMYMPLYQTPSALSLEVASTLNASQPREPG